MDPDTSSARGLVFIAQEALPDRLNMGCGLDVREGYLNADAYTSGPGVTRVEMTRTPWPFPSNHFKEILLSHVLEHVPPIFRRDREGRPRDVLMDVVEELYRVLRPEGVVDVRVPLGGTGLDFCHWQHYRHVTPAWFQYLNQSNFEAWPYKFNFEVAAPPKFRVWRARGDRYLKVRGHGLTLHLAQRFEWARSLLARDVEMIVTLRKIPMPAVRP